MDEVQNLLQPSPEIQKSAERRAMLDRLRVMLSSATGSVLIGFTATPLVGENEDARPLLNIIKGPRYASLNDEGFVSYFMEAPTTVFPEIKPAGVPARVPEEMLRRVQLANFEQPQVDEQAAVAMEAALEEAAATIVAAEQEAAEAEKVEDEKTKKKASRDSNHACVDYESHRNDCPLQAQQQAKKAIKDATKAEKVAHVTRFRALPVACCLPLVLLAPCSLLLAGRAEAGGEGGQAAGQAADRQPSCISRRGQEEQDHIKLAERCSLAQNFAGAGSSSGPIGVLMGGEGKIMGKAGKDFAETNDIEERMRRLKGYSSKLEAVIDDIKQITPSKILVHAHSSPTLVFCD